MAPRRAEFSKREKEIMDVIYRRGTATAAEVHEEMAEPPSYSAVRATLRILEEKGHLRHEDDGVRYVYAPTMTRSRASKNALEHLVSTFFDDSAEKVVAALLDSRKRDLSDEDLEKLEAMIAEARREGR
ncbi:MAG: BlaI/MecI/CopY family transcriptional regulator [Acidobacteria bacterium]|nr:BlaI/MecI/CopY family transcriptional regulator [Acidobacteriota bacterium]